MEISYKDISVSHKIKRTNIGLLIGNQTENRKIEQSANERSWKESTNGAMREQENLVDSDKYCSLCKNLDNEEVEIHQRGAMETRSHDIRLYRLEDIVDPLSKGCEWCSLLC